MSRSWVVTCDLTFDVESPALVTLLVTAACRTGQPRGDERLAVITAGRPLAEPRELVSAQGTRMHIVDAEPGVLTVSYRAAADQPHPHHPGQPGHDQAGRDFGLSQLVYLRPSRYCPSDHLAGFATAEFGTYAAGRETVEAVAEWINRRIAYVSGSSGVHDDAEHTLLTGQGVCRDFAHLGVALCRAMDVPARFVAVYAPGLTPMDFHAVFEAWVDGGWRIYDATRLVPRQAMVRIATGRDAADTAFASVLGGPATLRTIEVTATVTGDLPLDDHTAGVFLP